MSKESEMDVIEQKVEGAIDVLMEHCDAVQIFATILFDDGETGRYASGRGNHYARVGMAREWLDNRTAEINAFNMRDSKDE